MTVGEAGSYREFFAFLLLFLPSNVANSLLHNTLLTRLLRNYHVYIQFVPTHTLHSQVAREVVESPASSSSPAKLRKRALVCSHAH